MQWGFYGRTRELSALEEILRRQRWFFARITGRRRIGKTTLIQQALERAGRDAILYLQIPDSAPAGVLSAVGDALTTFGLDPERFKRPDSLRAFAQLIGTLVRAGYVVALDEFQYFSRKHLYAFTSHLQAVVDELAAQADEVPTGYRLSPRLPPASDMDVAASYPGRRPRAESIARADAFRAQPHHRASITTGPFSRGQGGAPATTRGANGSGVGVGGVEVAPEFEFEPAEAEEPALAERLRHERAQLGELAQEVIALSGQLKRPAVVPGLVTAREQAQRDPPTPLLLGSARARRPCPLRESARLTALGGSGHPQQAAGPLSAQPLPRRARARSLLPWAAPQSADALCL